MKQKRLKRNVHRAMERRRRTGKKSKKGLVNNSEKKVEEKI